MKLLLFGAGRIGRSFIAQLFYQAGYSITFVDIDSKLVDLINKRKSYDIIIKDKKESRIKIKNVKAIDFRDEEKIIDEFVNSDLCAVSVGQKGLPGVAKLISDGLRERYAQKPDSPIDIILAENLRNASDWMRGRLLEILPSDFPLNKYAGLVETSIGKMVPFMTAEDLKKDPLQVFAEPYNTLILDEKGFINPVPEVEGLAPKKNMKAWVDRKLFIHNLGHACLAYLAYIKDPEWKYTWEALEDRELKQEVFNCMQEASNVLIDLHPGEFTKTQLTEHINDLLERFSNKALGDTIFRVGCDLERKLGPEDRLVPVINYAHSKGFRFQTIMKALISAVYFDARDAEGRPFPSDQKFLHKFNRNVSRILIEHCKFEASENNSILYLALNLDEQIRKKLKR